MTDVVALELKARAATLAQLPHQKLEILEGVSENKVTRAFEMLRLPIVFPFLVSVEHWIKTEVHRTHVAGGHLRLGPECACKPFLKRHAMAAARCDV